MGTDKNGYIIGMSPGNSYFKDEKIKFLLKETVEKYKKVSILIPDVPAISTYIAYGYAENVARRDKAIPQGNLLRNKVQRAMTQLGYNEQQVIVIDWKDQVEPNNNYQSELTKIKELYNDNDQFQADVDKATEDVLLSSGRDFEDISKATKIAVHYLLSEIAFLEWAPDFLKTKEISYIYHNNWPVYENYITGKYDNKSKPHMHFMILRE